jgi:hypothetical protein
MGEYVARHIPDRIWAGYRREPLKPLHITQPDGPSFTLDGNLLQWQNWSLRVGFNYREGMTLHAVSYRDGERVRSVAHRLSFAEMVVPYRDPSADHYRRTAFDIGALRFLRPQPHAGRAGHRVGRLPRNELTRVNPILEKTPVGRRRALPFLKCTLRPHQPSSNAPPT